MATLIVMRKKSIMASTAKISIIVDGIRVGEVKNGGSIELDLQPGSHLISGRIGRIGLQRSEDHPVLAMGDERITVNIGPSSGFALGTAIGLPIFLIVYFITLNKTSISHETRSLIFAVMCTIALTLQLVFRKKYLTIEEF